MRGVSALLTLLLLLTGCGLAPTHVEYDRAEPGERVELPRDLYAHEGFRTEWWYYAGLLKSAGRVRFSYQLVFFKRRTDSDSILGLPLRYYSNPSHFAHLSITDLETGRTLTRDIHARDYLAEQGSAGARSDCLHVWNHDWSVQGDLERQRLSVRLDDGSGISLQLRSRRPYVLHGELGRVTKSREGNGGFYISQPRLETVGVLRLAGVSHPVTGSSWMDHEFGSRMLAPYQIGWDWFAINLEDGRDLMLYLLRREDGGYDASSFGTLVDRRGDWVSLDMDGLGVRVLEFWESDETGADYPVALEITLPARGLHMRIEAFQPAQEILNQHTSNLPYWEGAVRVEGELDGAPVRGAGFMELTGYARRLEHLSQSDRLR